MSASMPWLQSEHLELTAWSISHLAALVDACNDPELSARLGVPAPYTTDDARDYIDLCARGWVMGEQFTFAVADRATGAVLGSVRVGPSPSGATAGYWTAPWARGRNVATSALSLVTAWALDNGLSPVRLYVTPDNPASQRVALKAGYRRDEVGVILDPEGIEGDMVFSISN